MDLLKRELAPIVAGAWTEIDRQAKRVLTLSLAARKLVDLDGPHGWGLAAVNRGRVTPAAKPPVEGVQALLRQVQALVEVRVPFRLSRQELDSAARGAVDMDLDPVTEAAERIAAAEDHAVFNGYPDAGITGMIESSPHPPVALPASAAGYPEAILQALEVLRQAGVNGPYALAVGSEPFKQLAVATDNGYPIRKRLEQQVLEAPVLWAPAVPGAVLLSVRGGDFTLTVGTDLSIGYAAHDRDSVELFLVESFAFSVVDGGAAVHLRPAAASSTKAS
jgi:uncharacterized linocin/CFP29 family protein